MFCRYSADSDRGRDAPSGDMSKERLPWTQRWCKVYPQAMDLQQDFDEKVKRSLQELKERKDLEEWKMANLRKCPHCPHLMEKNRGCNLMKCGTYIFISSYYNLTYL